MTRVLFSQADTTDVQERAVAAAMRSGWVAPLGPSVDAFEHEMAQQTGVGSALALSSGTAALHLALLGVGVRPQTTVVVASLTFAASANAMSYAQARPVLVDSLPGDGNLDPDLVMRAVDSLQAKGLAEGVLEQLGHLRLAGALATTTTSMKRR